MQIHKPFLTYTQQIDKLEHEKNLVIADRNYAEAMLKQNSYYALISGYKKLFWNTTTKKYKNNTTFEEVVALYKYDESLRELFLKYILQIEQKMRSLLSYYFSMKHGNQQSKYLSPVNYDQSPKKARDLKRLIGVICNIVQTTTKYHYVAHHRVKYGNVPLWVLVKVLTFGNISMMYQCFTQDIQIDISKNFCNVNEKELAQFLRSMAKFRNICAHNDRLFSYANKDDIPDTVIHAKLGIVKKGTQYIYGKRDLFSMVVAFRYLLEKEDFYVFKRQMSRIIDRFVSLSNNVSHNVLLHEMGFPANWKKVSSFKI
ncbi:MAG: Abi family protein [Oscillospiraceae bacterium]|nr:Abi family protein [Oscillospiraceae bacterium]